MSGDYSRWTDRPQKRYTGVRMQQGRVQLDADWNEEVDLVKRRWETQAADTFGGCGVPRETTPDGFKVTLDGPDLKLGAGRIYVQGRLAEIFEGEQVHDRPASYLHQPFYPNPKKLPSSPYIVYLDVWDREVTCLEDPDLLEKALGEVDTSTRIQTVWQVKATGGTTVGEPRSGGRLSTRATQPAESTDPCKLPASGGYRGLENRLYRVEIQTGGDKLEDIRFKWSRENASVASAVESIHGKSLTVRRIGRDAVLRFRKGDWVEVLDDPHELQGQSGEMAQVLEVNEVERTISLARDVSGSFGKNETELKDRHTRVRRWDGLLTPQSGWMMLHEGIEIELTLEPKGKAKAGDYWVFAARTADNSVDVLVNEPPRGIEHFYCRLAAVNATQTEDCRPQWPPEAKAVEAPRAACCALMVSPENWQKVFEEGFLEEVNVSLCFAPGTYNLTKTLELKDLGHVKIEGAGAGTQILAPDLECALRFIGCGSVLVRDLAATTGVARSGEGQPTPERNLNGTLTFKECGPVTVSGATLECGSGGRRATACITVMGAPGQPLSLPYGAASHLWKSEGGHRLSRVKKARGPLVPVTAETADVQTGGTPVRIRGCDLRVGHGQVGILVVDGQRVEIEDNDIAVVPPSQRTSYGDLILETTFLAELRRQLISALRVDPPGKETPPQDSVTLDDVGGHTVRFETAKPLRDAWSALLKKRPLAAPATAKDVVNHLYALANEVLLDGKAGKEPLFRDLLLALRRDVRPVASQGIAIGGRHAGDVRILNNSVTGVLQGIHLGLSHRDQPRAGPADLAGRVRISGNRIVVLLAAGARGERHGIFLGSVDSAIVADNHVQVVRIARAEPPLRLQSVDGIRVYGWLGALLVVEHNHLAGCTTGIRVNSLNPPKDPHSVLRKISGNVLADGGTAVDATGVPAEESPKTAPEASEASPSS